MLLLRIVERLHSFMIYDPISFKIDKALSGLHGRSAASNLPLNFDKTYKIRF